MSRLFPVVIIVLFFAASGVCFCLKQPGKGFFYLLSGLINFNVMVMK